MHLGRFEVARVGAPAEASLQSPRSFPGLAPSATNGIPAVGTQLLLESAAGQTPLQKNKTSGGQWRCEICISDSLRGSGPEGHGHIHMLRALSRAVSRFRVDIYRFDVLYTAVVVAFNCFVLLPLVDCYLLLCASFLLFPA